MRILNDWIDGFMQLTENSEPPTMFRKWTAISTVASALQRKVRVELGISLTFYPNFYIVLVGPSATGKGTAMKYAEDIIRQVPTIRLAAQATSYQALIKRMKEANATDIELGTGKQQYHSSITIFSNEFTVFLGYHNHELIAALCDWYDCHPRWTYDTISRDREEIIGVWVNILGGTTPENIKSSLPLEAIGTGLTSRIIFICEERREKLVIFSNPSEEECQLQVDLINDLEQISLMSGNFGFTKDFMSTYATWCYAQAANPPFYDPKFDGYCGRRRNHLLSLSMVCSASRSNEMILRKDDIDKAAFYLAEAEVKMGLVFKGIGKSSIANLISDSITFIQNSETREISIRDFSRRFETDMDKLVMDRVLATLEMSGYIIHHRKPHGESYLERLDRS